MKLSDATEAIQAIEEANDQARAKIKKAEQDRLDRERRNIEDAELFAAIERRRTKAMEQHNAQLQSRTSDPDVFVRILGNCEQPVRVTIDQPQRRHSADHDYLACLATGGGLMLIITLFILKLLGVF